MRNRLNQWVRLNLGKRSKQIIFGSLMTTFELSSIFEASETVAKIGSSLKSNCQIKLRLSKSLIHMVRVCNLVLRAYFWLKILPDLVSNETAEEMQVLTEGWLVFMTRAKASHNFSKLWIINLMSFWKMDFAKLPSNGFWRFTTGLYVKASPIKLINLPGISFTNIFTCSFYAHRYQKRKKAA